MMVKRDCWESTHRVSARWITAAMLFVAGQGSLPIAPAQEERSSDPPEKEQQPSQRSDDLAKRLLEGERVDYDPMEVILRKMRRVESGLKRDFDPGEGTQALQREIIEELDAAIAAAARRGGGTRSTGGAESSDPRRQREPSRGSSPGTSPGNTQPEGGVSATGTPEETDTDGSANAALSRSWGNLPPRDRDEVIQGAREQSLEKFREWIDRYYRALAEENRR